MSGENEENLSERKLRKRRYKAKLIGLMSEYKNILVLGIDNVGSNQLQQVRIALRGKAVFLMGKNTIMRRVITDEAEENNPKLAALLPFIRGNIGFCFTNEDLLKTRDEIVQNKVPAAARSGALAPLDVFVPPGPTGLDPGQTAFFQALNIATKISRGTIEIINKVHLIKKAEKVTSSAVALLNKLGIKPFFFGVQVLNVYEDGDCYSATVLDLTPDDLLNKFFRGVGTAAALSLSIGFPTLASIPHSFARAFQRLVAIALVTDYIFEEAKPFKEFLDNPDAFKTAAAPAEEAAAEEAPAEEDSDEDDDAGEGFNMFGEEEEGY